MKLYLLAALLAFVSDFLWAYYIMSTASRRPIAAALSSGGIVVISATMVLAYMEDPVSIVFAVIGGMLGTYIMVKSKR